MCIRDRYTTDAAGSAASQLSVVTEVKPAASSRVRPLSASPEVVVALDTRTVRAWSTGGAGGGSTVGSTVASGAAVSVVSPVVPVGWADGAAPVSDWSLPPRPCQSDSQVTPA